MMDDLLRETFARREELVPVATPELGESIVVGARRLRALRRWVFSGLTFLCSMLTLLLMPFLSGPRTAPPVAAPPPGQPLNLLVIGVDRGSGEPVQVNANAIVLLHVNPGARTAYEVLLPRDFLLDLPGLGRQRADGAYLVGGYKLVAEAVAGLTGLALDGGAVIDVGGLETVTRAAGGVDLCAPGCRHYDPHEAVDRLRQSLVAGDGQVLHQYLTALAKAAAKPAVLAAAGASVELHRGSASLLDLPQRLGAVDPAGISAVKLPDRPAGDGLYDAMRNGRVGAWLDAHPQYAASSTRR
ncbi:LCP family protein [Dactylosporangium vinaceum]|uniref:LCP family protein n=1 Tax=Dactylosporangium vinaceum TaxID=53362 RepID=A0ABV5MPZ6_9ACTN|nr:LCP family protein [Dactylosporangium vinaceum]UAB96609.1 LCP family protein [Dactylosporangium vinaceum]